MSKLSLAIPKGRLFDDTVDLLLRSGIINERIVDNSRKLIVETQNGSMSFLLVRAKDVITYVEEGIADLGVVGFDLILEYDPDVFVLEDLGIGWCKLVVAGKENFSLEKITSLRVVTKYVNITRSFFRAKEIDAKIIELYGSVELGPITGLSDCIVDITSTGATLKENNLTVIEEIVESTSRLVSNKKSFYVKSDLIQDFLKKIRSGLSQV